MAGAPLHADVRFWRDPDLPGVEARSSTYSQNAFRTHTHKAHSIILVDGGSTRFSLNGTPYTASAGQMVIIEAEAPHACNPAPGSGLTYRLLSLAPELLRAEPSTPSSPLPRFQSPVLDDAELFGIWARLHAAFAQGAPTPEKSALLADCLGRLLSRHAVWPTSDPAAPSAAIALACQRIRATPGSFVPLDELASQAGLSRHHFLRVFKAATGLTPHAYQLQQAVELAKDLLAAGTPISQAAQDAGFADQSHFSRQFRRFTGATPRQYLAAL